MEQYQQIQKKRLYLAVKTQSWLKQSHSLFDYQSQKKINYNFVFCPQPKQQISFYLSRLGSLVVPVVKNFQSDFNPEEKAELFKLLAEFKIKSIQQKQKTVQIQFQNNYEPSNIQEEQKSYNQMLQQSFNQQLTNILGKKDSIFVCVRKSGQIIGKSIIKEKEQQIKGLPIHAGDFIRSGRIQFYVKQICINGKVTTGGSNPKIPSFFSKIIMNFEDDKQQNDIIKKIKNQKKICKLCASAGESQDNPFIYPCPNCVCKQIHLNCYKDWLKTKFQTGIGKQQVAAHYNFKKLECQVSKQELRIFIKKDGKKDCLFPQIRPQKGNYMILQSACQRSLSVIVIKGDNIPSQGILIGRATKCEIQITDISVSRVQSIIKFINDQFVLFDNNSKFGTLLRSDKMSLQIKKGKSKSVQIGRTLISFELKSQDKIDRIYLQNN